MFEVNVNRLNGEFEASELSGSIAERGKNAGKETWSNSVAAVSAPLLADDTAREAARDWAKGFGAWSDEDVTAWSKEELDALVLQYAAGDLRELASLAPGDGVAGIDWDEAEKLSERGGCGGNLFVHNDELWISLE